MALTLHFLFTLSLAGGSSLSEGRAELITETLAKPSPLDGSRPSQNSLVPRERVGEFEREYH